MSILLDALRKSEAQRQLGSAPTLQTPMGSDALSTGGNKVWIPATMSLLAAAIIAWIGLEQFHRAAPPAGKSASAVITSAQDVPAESPAPKQQERAKRSARTPVMDYAAAIPPPVSGRTRPEHSAEIPAPTDATDHRLAAAKPAPEEESPATRASSVPASRTARHRNSGIRGKPTERQEPYNPPFISYWQVPQSVREGMPELHITVLVYAQKPEDRFLLINGQRLREKEQLAEGLVLEEIQREKAIFSYGGYRFYVKN